MNDSCHIYERVMSHIRMSHVTHMNELCHTYESVMSHIRMSHVTHTNQSCHTYESVVSHIRMSHVTHTNESCHTYEWVMSHIRMSHVTHMNDAHVAHTNESCHKYQRGKSRIWIGHITRTSVSCHTYEKFMSRMIHVTRTNDEAFIFVQSKKISHALDNASRVFKFGPEKWTIPWNFLEFLFLTSALFRDYLSRSSWMLSGFTNSSRCKIEYLNDSFILGYFVS